MASARLMMTNRNKAKDGLGNGLAGMRYFEHGTGSISKLSNWTELTKKQFGERVVGIAGTFPSIPDDQNTEQRHVSVFVHGYNVSWEDSVERYDQVRSDLFDSRNLGQPILFAWPSNGSPLGYLPDREDARKCAEAFAIELTDLHDYMVAVQRLVARTNDLTKACRAKVSIIAHSMGNYVTQKALAEAAKRLNSPQLLTLVTQLAMVAADVDNDLFQKDKPHDSDGSLMANLCYRIGALYTGLDDVLGASAGLKHFGTRRLGRSGLADRNTVWDNVFDVDVSNVIQKKNIHSAVFDSPKAMNLLEEVLRGVDRQHLSVAA